MSITSCTKIPIGSYVHCPKWKKLMPLGRCEYRFPEMLGDTAPCKYYKTIIQDKDVLVVVCGYQVK